MTKKGLTYISTAVVFLLGFTALQAQEPESQWVRIWPSGADGSGTVRDAGGKQYPSAGPNSNTWFRWGGAGRWKTFTVLKNLPVVIKPMGDSGPGACLGHLVFRLSEFTDGRWTERFVFTGPDWSGVAPRGEPRYRYVYFVPKAGSIKIECTKGGFYVECYQARRKQEEKLTDEDRAKAATLIGKLEADSWHEREKAQRELKEMGRKILPVLEKNKNSPALEVRVRIKKIIKALTPRGTPFDDEEMKDDMRVLVEDLLLYIKQSSLSCETEPVKNLAAAGPHAVEPLERHSDSKSEHVRAAIAFALGKLKSAASVKVILSALTNDKKEEVRFQAAAALANFDTEEVRKALKEAAENDTSEKVCKQAAESLRQIEKTQTSSDE